MRKKPANMPRGKSMHPEERVVEREARRESWLRRLLRTARLDKGRPDQAKKPR